MQESLLPVSGRITMNRKHWTISARRNLLNGAGQMRGSDLAHYAAHPHDNHVGTMIGRRLKYLFDR